VLQCALRGALCLMIHTPSTISIDQKRPSNTLREEVRAPRRRASSPHSAAHQSKPLTCVDCARHHEQLASERRARARTPRKLDGSQHTIETNAMPIKSAAI
jgi:hypothetical protein